jgi:signal transduction histidine kinase
MNLYDLMQSTVTQAQRNKYHINTTCLIDVESKRVQLMGAENRKGFPGAGGGDQEGLGERTRVQRFSDAE